VTALIIWGMYSADQSKTNKYINMTSREVALLCTTDMATQYHIHPVLSIIIDGVKQPIPAEIGVTDTCMNSLHTHDATGTLHVEAPVEKDFTLGDFFAVWNKPFDGMHILDVTAAKEGEVVLTVDGQVTDAFENLVLTDGAQIVIEYKKAK
jgi:hypothetical protein